MFNPVLSILLVLSGMLFLATYADFVSANDKRRHALGLTAGLAHYKLASKQDQDLSKIVLAKGVVARTPIFGGGYLTAFYREDDRRSWDRVDAFGELVTTAVQVKSYGLGWKKFYRLSDTWAYGIGARMMFVTPSYSVRDNFFSRKFVDNSSRDIVFAFIPTVEYRINSNMVVNADYEFHESRSNSFLGRAVSEVTSSSLNFNLLFEL